MRKLLPSHSLVVAVLLLTGCRRAAEEPAEAPDRTVPVSVLPVRVQAVQRTVEVVGTLYGDEEVTVSAKIPGRIRSVECDIGDAAGPDTVLAHLDPADIELAVAQREAALQAALADLALLQLPEGDFDPDAVPAVARTRIDAKNAEARFRRAAAMFAEQPPLITEQEHDDLQSARDAAKTAYEAAATGARASLAQARLRAAELATSRQVLADTVLRAPRGHDFKVAQRMVSAGEYVREGTPMFHLVALDRVKFRAEVQERHAAAVRTGQSVVVEVAAWTDAFQGQVARIAPQVDSMKRTFQIEITIANQDGRLLPGGFARGAVQTRRDEQVVFVPQEAVVTALGQSKVFTLTAGKAKEHKVTTGVHDGVFLEVQKGDLVAGDLVVTAGASRLAEGVPARVTTPGAGK